MTKKQVASALSRVRRMRRQIEKLDVYTQVLEEVLSLSEPASLKPSDLNASYRALGRMIQALDDLNDVPWELKLESKKR